MDLGARSTYVRRQPEGNVLHRVVREHLETFLAEARLRGGGKGLPAFIEREFLEFLSSGVLARGFARFRCRDCQREILVAFSCKGRAFCPSCCGRRMAEWAAHLVDGVLGGLLVRRRIVRLVARHGIELEDPSTEAQPADERRVVGRRARGVRVRP